MGTVNVLDIAFKKDFIKAIIVVTTDKVYKNDNSGHAFVESDPLEGKDPYSASKVGTEAVVAAWQQIAKVSGGPNVVSVRAGNVIGGGDYAEQRIIPDLIRGIINGKTVEIRNPDSTRPWEHVVEPLIGYIKALELALDGMELIGVNFGPYEKGIAVREVVKIFLNYFQGNLTIEFLSKPGDSESVHLSLNPEYAKHALKWEMRLSQYEAIELTAKWWSKYFSGSANIDELCSADIRFIIEKHSREVGEI